jgi:ABC-type multidrug transport system ATPase subunit
VLSRGQIYKTALIGMIVADPELWLLDEPLASGMDPLGLTAFRRHAREAVQRGRTVIYSTQLLDAVERFSDRVGVIHQGKMRAFDSIAVLRERIGASDNVLEELFIKLRQEVQ